MNNLPPDIIFSIANYLNVGDLEYWSRVDSRFQTLFNEKFWEKRFRKDYPDLITNKHNNLNYKLLNYNFYSPHCVCINYLVILRESLPMEDDSSIIINNIYCRVRRKTFIEFTVYDQFIDYQEIIKALEIEYFVSVVEVKKSYRVCLDI